MAEVDLTEFELQDLYLMKDGSIGTRASLRSVFNVSSLALKPAATIAAAASVRTPSNQMLHYLVCINTANAVQILVINDEGVLLWTNTYGQVTQIQDVSFSVVGREIIISSPSFPTLYGLLGSGLIVATPVASINPDTTAIAIPRGISVSWQNRVVIADGNAIHISDALAIRTYVAANIIGIEGYVYGLHVDSGGNLIVISSSGAFAFPADAAGTGQIAVGALSKISDYRAAGFRKTAFSNGAVFGVSPRGLRIISSGNKKEIVLLEKYAQRKISVEKGRENFEDASVFSTKVGPLVVTQYGVCLFHVAAQKAFWWTNTGFIFGVAENDEGQWMLVNNDHILLPQGDHNDFNGGTIKGVFTGKVPTDAELSAVVRFITTSSDTEQNQQATINGQLSTMPSQQVTPLIGTAVWGVDVYGSAQVRSSLHRLNMRTDDIRIEVGISGGMRRVGRCAIEVRGQSPRRPIF